MIPNDHQLLQSLIGSTPDRIFFKDTEGRFILVNDAVAHNFRVHSKEEVVGKTDYDFLAAEQADAARADELRIIQTGKPVVNKIEREVMAGGREGWAATTKLPLLNEKGEIVGVCGISRDVTKPYTYEQQVRTYAKELREQQAQIKRDLALAGEIQQALILSRPPANSDWLFTHRYLPSGTLGGDFFSIIPISPIEVGVLICDVTGHGVHAALITVAQRLLVDELQQKWSDPGLFLREMNRRLCQLFTAVSHPYYVTAFYCVLNAQQRTMVFANAGHPPPMVINRLTRSVRELQGRPELRQFALGMAEDSAYLNESAPISAGDQLLFYTDGLLDLEIDSVKQKLTRSVFHEILLSHLAAKPDNFLDEIVKSVKEFSPEECFYDDVCLVAAELKAVH